MFPDLMFPLSDVNNAQLLLYELLTNNIIQKPMIVLQYTFSPSFYYMKMNEK